jgi:hypothetical protein
VYVGGGIFAEKIGFVSNGMPNWMPNSDTIPQRDGIAPNTFNKISTKWKKQSLP